MESGEGSRRGVGAFERCCIPGTVSCALLSAELPLLSRESNDIDTVVSTLLCDCCACCWIWLSSCSCCACCCMVSPVGEEAECDIPPTPDAAAALAAEDSVREGEGSGVREPDSGAETPLLEGRSKQWCRGEIKPAGVSNTEFGVSDIGSKRQKE